MWENLRQNVRILVSTSVRYLSLAQRFFRNVATRGGLFDRFVRPHNFAWETKATQAFDSVEP
jgi:hypothetical protein